METGPSTIARRRLTGEERPLLRTDWQHVVFLHLAVDPRLLQPSVPFPLDLWNGEAYVSIVAFQQRRFAALRGGRVASRIVGLVGHHDFCNQRTYVRVDGEPGVFFLREWISRRLTVAVARITYGLPYRYASLEYRHDVSSGICTGLVTAGGERLVWRTAVDYGDPGRVSVPGSLDAFCLERYTAYTSGFAGCWRFHIWHESWAQQRIEVERLDDRLLRATFPWYTHGRLALANYSPGVREVWIGGPHRCGPARTGMPE